MERHCILLDRDGTLNVDTHYLSCSDQLVLLPGVITGLQRLQTMGFSLIVLTNQSGVARGYFSINQVTTIHTHLTVMLAAKGVTLDGFYLCPHSPDDNCICRKPRPGLVEQARLDYGFNPRQTYIIGDKATDIALGQAVGIVTILVRTGYGAETEQMKAVIPDFVVSTLTEAAIVIEHRLAYAVTRS